MTTVGCISNNNSYCQKSNIMQMEKPTRIVVREEIERKEKLEELKQKYENGEISKFEYAVMNVLLNAPVILDSTPGNHPGVKFSTTA